MYTQMKFHMSKWLVGVVMATIIFSLIPGRPAFTQGNSPIAETHLELGKDDTEDADFAIWGAWVLKKVATDPEAYQALLEEQGFRYRTHTPIVVVHQSVEGKDSAAEVQGWKSYTGRFVFRQAARIIRYTPDKWIRVAANRTGFGHQADNIIRNKVRMANKLDAVANHMDHVRGNFTYVIAQQLSHVVSWDIAWAAAQVISFFLF